MAELRPLNDQVLLRRVPMRESEILITPEPQKSWASSAVRDRSNGRGVVIATGPGKLPIDKQGFVCGPRMAPHIKTGDLVSFYEAGGEVTTIGELLLVPECDIQAVIE